MIVKSKGMGGYEEKNIIEQIKPQCRTLGQNLQRHAVGSRMHASASHL